MTTVSILVMDDLAINVIQGRRMTTVPFKIKRQFGPDLDPYWEKFELPHSPNSNVISYLMDIRKNPINPDGVRVPPIVWDCSCLEEVWNLYHENQRTG